MRRQRKWIVALAVIVMTTAFSFVLARSPERGAVVGDLLMPVQKIVTGVQNRTVDIIKHFEAYNALSAENEQLRGELGEARSAMAEAAALEEENEVLRKQLKLAQRDETLNLLPACISSGVSGFQIDKGKTDGLEMFMPVTSEDGFLGFISVLGENWSTVTPLSSKEFSAGSMNCRTHEIGVLRGTGDGLRMECLLPTSCTKPGDLIVTRGGDFPDGLVVGEVESVFEEENGLSRTAVLSPLVDIRQTETVFVILKQYDNIM